MSRDKTIVPTGLPDWPRFKSLDSIQRLVYMQLWISRELMSIGVGLVSHARLADGASQSVSSIPGVLDFLSQIELIVYDQATGELFVLDWFRFHTFKGVGGQIARKELKKIESKAIRKAVVRAIRANQKCGINLEKSEPEKNESEEKVDFSEKSDTCCTNTNTNTNTNNNNNNNCISTYTHPAPLGAGSTQPAEASWGGCDAIHQPAPAGHAAPAPQQPVRRGGGNLPPFPERLMPVWQLIKGKVRDSRHKTLKTLLESLRRKDGQALGEDDWERFLFRLHEEADDPIAYIKGIHQRGGWDPRSLADAARPGETVQQVKERIVRKDPPSSSTQAATARPQEPGHELPSKLQPRSRLRRSPEESAKGLRQIGGLKAILKGRAPKSEAAP